MILRSIMASRVLPACAGLLVINDGERCRSRGIGLLAPPPAPPPGAPPLDARHKLPDAIIPLARLYFQRGLCPRLCGHGNVPASTLQDKGEIGLGRELQS